MHCYINFELQSSRGATLFDSNDLRNRRLVFLGKFHQGKAYGPCWRFYDGGGYLYGVVNNEGAFTGLANFTYYHISCIISNVML